VTWTTAFVRVTAALAVVTFSFQVQAEVVVGVAVPSGGAAANSGVEIRAAAEAGVARLNQAGGVAGEAIRLVHVDDDCSDAGGQAAARVLAEQRAVLVMGHPCSNAAVAAAKIYAAAGIWLVALGATHPDLIARRAGPTIFRLGPRDDRQAADTAEIITKIIKDRRVALVHDRTAYARALVDGVGAHLTVAGIPVAAVEGIVAGETHYGPTVARLVRARVGLVYFAGFEAELTVLRGDMRAAGVAAQIVSSDATLSAPAVSASAAQVRASPFARWTEGGDFAMAKSGSPLRERHWVGSILDAFIRSERKLDMFASELSMTQTGEQPGPSFVPSLFVP